MHGELACLNSQASNNIHPQHARVFFTTSPLHALLCLLQYHRLPRRRSWSLHCGSQKQGWIYFSVCEMHKERDFSRSVGNNYNGTQIAQGLTFSKWQDIMVDYRAITYSPLLLWFVQLSLTCGINSKWWIYMYICGVSSHLLYPFLYQLITLV